MRRGRDFGGQSVFISPMCSSDGEDFDKEHTDPVKDKSIHRELLQITDLRRSFIDDEAEEDDENNDLIKSPDDDESDEGEGSAEINDLIATTYKEMPGDQERCNQLHQEWLQQKDAAETRDMLQRLKRRRRQEDEQTGFLNEYSIKYTETKELSLAEGVSANIARENSKKAKQTMAQMFDDQNDGFVSSDEEETNNRLSCQRILEQTENTSITSPVDNAKSREVFSLIKKLNVAPDPKKRKPTLTYEPLHSCGNSNSSSKSSFIRRATNNSLQPSHKQCNATFKSFVFGRDDSNSRSAISNAEDSSDEIREAQHKGTATARFTGSQTKHAKPTSGEETSLGPSLFEILRRSSVLYDNRYKKSNQVDSVVSETQFAHQLTAFKLRRKAPTEI